MAPHNWHQVLLSNGTSQLASGRRFGLGTMSARGGRHSRSVTPETSWMRCGRSLHRRGPSGGQLVVEQVIEKVALVGPADYPMLMKTNYNQWSLLMKIKLRARGLWSAFESSDIEFQLDRMALDVICSAVPAEMVTTLATKDTIMEAWDSIKDNMDQ
jgi:hypothetical protein